MYDPAKDKRLQKSNSVVSVLFRTVAVIGATGAVVAAVVAVLILLIGLDDFRSFQDSHLMDSSAQAQILSKENGWSPKSCRVRYSFEVNGVRYEGPERSGVDVGRRCYRFGFSTVSVKYDSENPSHNTLSPALHFSSSAVYYVLLCIVVVFAWGVGFISTLKRARKAMRHIRASRNSVVIQVY